jgi:hypothetical protein
MAIEALVASHEDAANGIAEIWVDGRLFATTGLDEHRHLALNVEPGPWHLDYGELKRALAHMEELLAQDLPGIARGTRTRR